MQAFDANTEVTGKNSIIIFNHSPPLATILNQTFLVYVQFKNAFQK